MKCNQCGADAPAQATFCPQCGVQLNQRVGAPGFQAGGAQGSARNIAEQELWAGSYSPKAMTGPFVGAALLTVVALIGASFVPPFGWIAVGIGALLLFGYLGLLAIYRRISERFRLTSQRLIIERGILSRTGDHTLVINIDDVTVSQGLFERMLNLGKIVLNTKDKTTPTITMLGIENPRHVADLIDEARRTERNRRGLYTMDA